MRARSNPEIEIIHKFKSAHEKSAERCVRMIRGYGIYIGMNVQTGMMYAGSVHSSKANWTPEKGLTQRIRAHEKDGKVTFAWRLVHSENREVAGLSHISEKYYKIRIAVDEDRVIQNIPIDRRLNKISPLIQIDTWAMNEEMQRLGGRIGGRTTGGRKRGSPKARERGRKLGLIQGRKNAESGLLTRIATKESCGRGGRIVGTIYGPITGRKNKESGQIAALGRTGMGGRKAKEMGVGVHAPGVAANGGRSTSREHKCKIGPIGLHNRWHVARGIINPKCSLCTASTALPVAA
jgi:hypothetical protein